MNLPITTAGIIPLTSCDAMNFYCSGATGVDIASTSYNASSDELKQRDVAVLNDELKKVVSDEFHSVFPEMHTNINDICTDLKINMNQFFEFLSSIKLCPECSKGYKSALAL